MEEVSLFNYLFFAVGCFNSLTCADLDVPSAAPETHIVNGRRYGTSELSSQSIFTLVKARQDQQRGI